MYRTISPHPQAPNITGSQPLSLCLLTSQCPDQRRFKGGHFLYFSCLWPLSFSASFSPSHLLPLVLTCGSARSLQLDGGIRGLAGLLPCSPQSCCCCWEERSGEWRGSGNVAGSRARLPDKGSGRVWGSRGRGRESPIPGWLEGRGEAGGKEGLSCSHTHTHTTNSSVRWGCPAAHLPTAPQRGVLRNIGVWFVTKFARRVQLNRCGPGASCSSLLTPPAPCLFSLQIRLPGRTTPGGASLALHLQDNQDSQGQAPEGRRCSWHFTLCSPLSWSGPSPSVLRSAEGRCSSCY